jgi:hypothetical protein
MPAMDSLPAARIYGAYAGVVLSLSCPRVYMAEWPRDPVDERFDFMRAFNGESHISRFDVLVQVLPSIL